MEVPFIPEGLVQNTTNVHFIVHNNNNLKYDNSICMFYRLQM